MRSEAINAPYCSTKLVFDEKTLGDLFYVIFEPEIQRLKNRIQLGRLTHPVTEEGAHQENGYLWFPFSHSRYDHSILMIPPAVILLTKLGFSQEFIRQFILIAFSHDIYTPINGDASMRLNKELLCEVRNYKSFMIKSGVGERWKKRVGFNLDDADDAVRGVGIYAFWVDFFDRWSYTILDVWHLGKRKPEKIAKLIRRNPHIADVWQDICATKEHVYFSNARRLHKFLLLRALMHTEFYYNPMCRKLEHLFFCEERKLFEAGKISVDDLHQKDERWLDAIVREGKEDSWCTHPHDLGFERFETEQEADFFTAENSSVFYKERIKPFETGMHWLVMHRGKVMPLCEALPKKMVDEMENLSRSRVGWYVYFLK